MSDLFLWALLVDDHHLRRITARYTTAISPSRNAPSTRLDFGIIFKVLILESTILALFLLLLLMLVNLRVYLLVELFGPLLLISQDFLARIRIHIRLVAFEQCLLSYGSTCPSNIFDLWHRIRVLVFPRLIWIFVTLAILSLLAAILLLLVWECRF